MSKLLPITLMIFFFGCSPKQKETAIAVNPERLSTYEDLQGNEIKLTDFSGKRVFLNFWATWCKPCIKEMPDIEKASELLKNDNYIFLLASDESHEKIRDFISKHDFKFKFIKFNGSYEELNIYSLPTTFIYDSKGKKAKHMTGPYDWSKEKVLSNLKRVP